MTPKGKVVFTATGIILLVLVFMFVQSLQPDQVIPDNNAANEEMTTDSSNTDQMDMGSNGDETTVPEGASNDVANETNTISGSDIDTSQQADNCKYPGSGDQDSEDMAASVNEDAAQALYNAKTTVYFDPDKYDLQDEYKLVLNIFAGTAKAYPDEMIKVEGNINGYPKFNDSKFGEELSQIRASKVAQYLMNMGISEERIIVESNGSSKPLNKSDTAEELMLNRRTDVYFADYLIEEEENKK